MNVDIDNETNKINSIKNINNNAIKDNVATIII